LRGLGAARPDGEAPGSAFDGDAPCAVAIDTLELAVAPALRAEQGGALEPPLDRGAGELPEDGGGLMHMPEEMRAEPAGRRDLRPEAREGAHMKPLGRVVRHEHVDVVLLDERRGVAAARGLELERIDVQEPVEFIPGELE